MAKKIWVGTSGDWTTAANWNPVNQPANGDVAHFTGDSVVDVDGLTLADTFDALGGIFVHPDYTGSIGTTGSKIIADTVDIVRFESQGGRLFLEAEGVGESPAEGDINDVVVNTPAGLANMLEIKGRVSRFQVVGTTGTCTITASGGGPTKIFMMDSPNCTLTIGANVTFMHYIRQNSGRIICSSPIATALSNQVGQILVTGGIFEHKAGEIKQVNLAGSGIIEYTSGGTITEFTGFGPGSLFDGRKNRASSITLTDAELFPGCTMLLKNALDSFVLPTNGVRNFGGVLDLETGRGVKKE